MKTRICRLVVLPVLAVGFLFAFAAGCGSGDEAAKKEAAKAAPKGAEKDVATPTPTTAAQ